MKLSALKINSAAVEAGVWVDKIPDMGDLRLKVRGLGNADYRRLNGQLLDAVPRDKRVNGVIDPAEADRIAVQLILQTVLLDWQGLTDDQNKPIAFSVDAAEKFLTDPDFRPFRGAIMWASASVGNEAAASTKEAAKN